MVLVGRVGHFDRKDGRNPGLEGGLLSVEGYRAPDFFLVGAPKCATTALHGYLREHPEIFLPERKELHYYGSDLGGLPSRLTDEEHRGLFAGADGAGIRAVGETCIWALYSKLAAGEIRRARPEARILVALRDPVEMIHALHGEFLYHGIETIGTLRGALRAEARRTRVEGGRLPCGGIYPRALYAYRSVGAFAEQVERYLEAFGGDRVHVVLHDDLKRDAAGVHAGLLRFLGVSPRPMGGFPLVNPNKALRSLTLQRALTSPDHWAARAGRALARDAGTRARIHARLWAWNVTRRPRKPLPRGLARGLAEHFARDVERLGALLGRDLSDWTRRHGA